MNNHLVGKTDILEPRAKIGDVVIVKEKDELVECKVTKEFPSRFHFKVYYLSDGLVPRYNQDILKNLTTNVSYE